MGDGDVLARLLDEHDVVELLYVYCETADAETPAAFVDCFTRDGLFTYRAHVATELAFSVRGHADLETWFVQRLPVVPPGTMNHTTVHPRVTIGGAERGPPPRFI